MIASKHNQDISSYNLWLAIYKHSFLACFHLKLKNIFNKLCSVIQVLKVPQWNKMTQKTQPEVKLLLNFSKKTYLNLSHNALQ